MISPINTNSSFWLTKLLLKLIKTEKIGDRLVSSAFLGPNSARNFKVQPEPEPGP